MPKYNLTHLKELESEAIYVIREVFAQFEKREYFFGWKRLYSSNPLGQKGIFSC